ncbi:hypothetical protein SteCoe_8451 [Stentor coeruleus]|uniref:ABC transporter domain-containing protein n=1 Tax=Stentor coeruleus TaxID=5963 RepID=A0A1R2CKD7_9CILI|nr:hypothetical protein SteCoe_8451 [Stentor coeruleus]
MANQYDPLTEEPNQRLLETKDSENIVKIYLEWNNIECGFRSKNDSRQILKGMTGFARPGEFLAIMGTSGSGKTIFLNALTGAVRNSSRISLSGEILANKQSIYDINFYKYIGYVTQDDILLDMLTVRESVTFAARLKNVGSDDQKIAKVDSVLTELGLMKCQHTLIGNEAVKGVSGGEKKRVCIAIELITTPSVLFLDEPTSGLDSFTSYNVIEILNQQAAKGRTVISTIHQPSSDIFKNFDKLMLICDGTIVYHGNAKDAVDYFNAREYPCPALSNPADYFMEILHVDNAENRSEKEVNKVNFLMKAHEEVRVKLVECSEEKLETGSRGYISSYPVQIYHCTKRAVLISVRDPKLTIFKLVILLFVALLMSILFWRIDGDTDITSQNNRNGSFFFALITLVYANLNATILNFPLMRAVFLKESRAKMYGTTAFYLAKNIADFLIEVFTSIMFGLCIYWTIGYNTSSSDKPIIFLVICVLANMCGTSLGLTAGAWFTRVDVAASLGAIMSLPFYYYSGFLRPVDSIPIAFRWLSYISPFRWVFFSLMLNEYKDSDRNKGGVLEEYNIHGTVGESICWLIVVLIGFRLLAFVGLKLNSRI